MTVRRLNCPLSVAQILTLADAVDGLESEIDSISAADADRTYCTSVRVQEGPVGGWSNRPFVVAPAGYAITLVYAYRATLVPAVKGGGTSPYIKISDGSVSFTANQNIDGANEGELTITNGGGPSTVGHGASLRHQLRLDLNSPSPGDVIGDHVVVVLYKLTQLPA